MMVQSATDVTPRRPRSEERFVAPCRKTRLEPTLATQRNELGELESFLRVGNGGNPLSRRLLCELFLVLRCGPSDAPVARPAERPESFPFGTLVVGGDLAGFDGKAQLQIPNAWTTARLGGKDVSA